MRRTAVGRFSQWVGDGYHRLGCGAILFLFVLLALSGVFGCRVAGAAAICLQFGTQAYLRGQVWVVPHRGPLTLNDNYVVTSPLALVVFLAVWLGIIAVSMAIGILLAVGVNEVIGKVRQSRRCSEARPDNTVDGPVPRG